MTSFETMLSPNKAFPDHVSYMNFHQRQIIFPTVPNTTIFGHFFIFVLYDVLPEMDPPQRKSRPLSKLLPSVFEYSRTCFNRIKSQNPGRSDFLRNYTQLPDYWIVNASYCTQINSKSNKSKSRNDLFFDTKIKPMGWLFESNWYNVVLKYVVRWLVQPYLLYSQKGPKKFPNRQLTFCKYVMNLGTVRL